MEPNSTIKTEKPGRYAREIQSDSSDDEIRTPIRRRREFTFSCENQQAFQRNGGMRISKKFLFPSDKNPDNSNLTESISTNFKEGLVEGLDDTVTQVAPILRTMSLRVRQQVQITLSDPLKRRADIISSELRESKKKVEQLSAKLHVPAFLNNSVRSLSEGTSFYFFYDFVFSFQ